MCIKRIVCDCQTCYLRVLNVLFACIKRTICMYQTYCLRVSNIAFQVRNGRYFNR